MGASVVRILLLGNPNCGKTTLFNALTGEQQKIGNWPGVTVEKKQGSFSVGKQSFSLTDLPGIYSLSNMATANSLDEQIAAQSVLEMDYDLILNVVDTCHLERHLYLSSQLLELGKPMVVALNMCDMAQQQGIHIHERTLTERLGCPVVAIQAHKGIGVEALKAQLCQPSLPVKNSIVALDAELGDFYERLFAIFNAQTNTQSHAHYLAHRALEGDAYWQKMAGFSECLQAVESDILAADARYHAIHELTMGAQHRQSARRERLTARIDAIVLNRFLALPIFLGMMYAMFLFAINIGGAFQDFFDISTEALFVQTPAWLLAQVGAPEWLIALIADGAGKGVNTTLTFIPVIAAMFFFLSALEASGYMARAAFVVDRIMRWLGLPGKSFVPMIVGFGCNVPSIMAARTLENPRDRLLTILMSPFMSCSARLAIYAVFVAAFFPSGGQNVVFSLYIIGILMAVFTGMLLRNTHLQGASSPLILELPTYHRPSLRRLIKQTMHRLKFFLIRAGRLIVPICVFLGGLNSIMLPLEGEPSVLAYLGRCITPLFSPMGIQSDNWPATVGLLSGLLAKEVVIGTLNSLYSQLMHLQAMHAEHFSLLSRLWEALCTIPENIGQLGQALINPVLASAKQDPLSQSVYGMMVDKFNSRSAAYAYLLFVLLYVPCVSTMAGIRQEASRRWMWFSIIWSTLLAYASAVVVYQLANFVQHPVQSVLYTMLMLGLIGAFVWYMYYQGRKKGAGGTHVATNT